VEVEVEVEVGVLLEVLFAGAVPLGDMT
jgi:hypothetical protein